jgi:hypothetical protein
MSRGRPSLRSELRILFIHCHMPTYMAPCGPPMAITRAQRMEISIWFIGREQLKPKRGIHGKSLNHLSSGINSEYSYVVFHS